MDIGTHSRTFNPEPNESHGWTYQVGVIQPLWTSADVIPKQLVDIVDFTVENTEDKPVGD